MDNENSRWKEMQISMAIEGYEISDEELGVLKACYKEDGREGEADSLVDEAKKTGRSILEIARERIEGKKRD